MLFKFHTRSQKWLTSTLNQDLMMVHRTVKMPQTHLDKVDVCWVTLVVGPVRRASNIDTKEEHTRFLGLRGPGRVVREHLHQLVIPDGQRPYERRQIYE